MRLGLLLYRAVHWHMPWHDCWHDMVLSCYWHAIVINVFNFNAIGMLLSLTFLILVPIACYCH